MLICHFNSRNAMDNASKNAADMIGALQLKYNRGRQAAITNELVDIITGPCFCLIDIMNDFADVPEQVPVRSEFSGVGNRDGRLDLHVPRHVYRNRTNTLIHSFFAVHLDLS
jgi:hypothetical protein